MIASFGDRATEDLYHGRQTARARRFPGEVVDAALVKMGVNDQWRLIFRWEGSDAHDVRLADYH